MVFAMVFLIQHAIYQVRYRKVYVNIIKLSVSHLTILKCHFCYGYNILYGYKDILLSFSEKFKAATEKNKRM